MLKKLSPIVATLIMGCLLVVGCRQNIEPCLLDDCVPPTDKAPAITLLAPTNNNVLALPHDIVAFDYRLDDNEALKVFRVTGQYFDQKDSLIGNEFIARPDTVISGKTSFQGIRYVTPQVAAGYKIRLSAYAIDTKGTYTKTISWVNVVDTLVTPPATYLSNEYKNYTIFSKLSTTHPTQYAFDFAGINPPTNMNSVDVMETSSVTGTFSRILKPGPINTLSGVFVMTNAQSFNYDLLTYFTTYEAFFSNPQPKLQTTALNVGDIVIVRLQPVSTISYNFVVMRVKEVNDDPNNDDNDYITFDYKQTYRLN